MQFSGKKRICNLLLALLLCIVTCFGVACKKKPNEEPTPELPPEEVLDPVLNEIVLELSLGDTFTLCVLNLQEEESVVWKSTETSIASVDSEGNVTALSPGKTKVLATVGKKTFSCMVTVGVKLDLVPTLALKDMPKKDGEYRLNLMRGDEYELSPVLCLGLEEVEASFTLTSSADAVAVDGYTLKANGVTQNAQISVSCAYEGETYSLVCYVSVEEVAL